MTRAPATDQQLAMLRIASLEAAYLDLLGRLEELEQALRFEIDQRVELERVILKVSGLGKRVDRLEMGARAARRGCILTVLPVEGGK